MKYRVSDYINEIKKVDLENLHPVKQLGELAIYTFFDTYEEAKSFLISRAKNKIASLEKEIKYQKSRLPKLEKLTEKTKP